MRTVLKLMTLTVVAAVLAMGLGASARPEGPAGPLAAYPGFGHDPAADEARFTAEEREREDLVAACMAARGFRYVPAPSIVVTGTEAEPPDLTDPNDAYVRALTPILRTAYHLALTGVTDPYAQDAQALEPVGGCLEEAITAVPGVYAARGALASELEAMEAAIAADPRLARAVGEWSACMRAEGFRFSSPAEAHADLDERVGEAVASGSDLQTLEDEHARLLEADAACSASLRETADRVRWEAEERFVADHRQTLERRS